LLSSGEAVKQMPPVALVCPECRATFERPAWRVRQAEKNGTILRCSYACAHAARRIHTPESKAEYHRAYREKNRDWINEKQKAARQGAKREYIHARDREIYKRNAEENRRRAREYAAAHKDEARERARQWAKDNPKKHAFHTVRSNLAKKLGVKPRCVPQDLVEAHREYLEIRRWALAQVKASQPSLANPSRPREKG
jgi:hypothetical protein